MANSPYDIDEEALSSLQNGFDAIMLNGGNGIDLKTYLRLYTLVHNICTSHKSVKMDSVSFLRDHKAQGRRNVFPLGGNLYAWLNECLRRHLQALHDEIATQPEEALVPLYVEQWSRYMAAAKYNKHLFRFVERHWIKREQDEGSTDVYDIQSLHLLRWKEDVLERDDSHFLATLRQHIDQGNCIDDFEATNVEAVLESFAAVCVKEGKEAISPRDIAEGYATLPQRAIKVEGSPSSHLII